MIYTKNQHYLDNRSEIPDEQLIEILDFVSPKRSFDPCQIIIKNCVDSHSCDFHWGGNKDPYIILRFGHKDWFPLSFKLRSDKIARTGYFDGYYNFPTKESCIVFCAAHEIRHWMQLRDNKMRNWLYRNRPLAEQDADNYAFKKLKESFKIKLI